MSAYKSKTYPVQATREQVYAKLANPGALAEKVKNLPPDEPDAYADVPVYKNDDGN